MAYPAPPLVFALPDGRTIGVGCLLEGFPGGFLQYFTLESGAWVRPAGNACSDFGDQNFASNVNAMGATGWILNALKLFNKVFGTTFGGAVQPVPPTDPVAAVNAALAANFKIVLVNGAPQVVAK